jgi:SAM-dependent methyltransferase
MEFTGERFLPRIENTRYSRFDPFIAYEHWHRYYYAAPFAAGKVVLDIASGEGYGSDFLARVADRVYGVDLSAEAVEHSQRTYGRDNLRFLQGSADAIPIAEDHSFDLIVSFETIEHLDAPSQERFASEIKRLLKPDGTLLVSTPDRMIYSDANAHQNHFHLREYSKQEYLEFLSRYFGHVCILSQHVFPISQIWNPEGSRGEPTDYQIAFDGGAFRLVEEDGRKGVYLIAVCSDRGELADGPDSQLVDLTEVAFRGIPGLDQWQMNSLFLDSGSGYRSEEMISEEVAYRPEFTLKFTLDPTRPIRRLRWDPLEQRLCRVRLRQVDWEDGAGIRHQLDLGQVASNGLERGTADFQFMTLDPMIFFPIAGSVVSLTITGVCHVADHAATSAGLETALLAREGALAEREAELRSARNELGVQEQAFDACRRRLALTDEELRVTRELLTESEDDLQSAREQLTAQEQTSQALAEELRGHEREIDRLGRVIRDIDQVWAELDARHRAILNSRRWIISSRIRSVLYFLPRRILAGWGLVRRALANRPVRSTGSPAPGRPHPTRPTRSNEKTLK